MKSNELRIGNLICKFGIPYVVKATTIHNLNKIEKKRKVCIDLSPMLITDEWLLSLPNESPYNFFREGVLTICQPNESNFKIKKLGNDYYFDLNVSGYSCVKLNYVHQLQNLYFAITNQELQTNAITSTKKRSKQSESNL